MARPSQPKITRRIAAKAALAEIDARGLEELSLGNVAARMGVKAPSLYHHFADKDDLLAETARQLLAEGKLPEAVEGLDWREELVRISCASRRSILKHPQAAGLLLRFFPRRLLMGAYARWAEVLALNGVPAEWRMVVLEGSEKLTFGSALFAAAMKIRRIEPFRLQDAERYPFLAEAHEANSLDDEQTFVAELRAFLHGVPLDRSPGDFVAAKPNGI